MRMPLFCDNIEVNFTIRTLLGDVKETRSKLHKSSKYLSQCILPGNSNCEVIPQAYPSQKRSLSDLIPLLIEQGNNEEN